MHCAKPAWPDRTCPAAIKMKIDGKSQTVFTAVSIFGYISYSQEPEMVDDFTTIDTLRSAWVQQIQLEFDDICQMHEVALERPMFEISDAEVELGGWCGATRTLRISRHLITGYSWAVTQQVLKHEMAHQLCDELFGIKGGGHGKQFQKGCELLGVMPEYRGHRVLAAGALEELAGSPKVSKKEHRFLSRVEKLLALGRSSNVHEAELAIQKANELIERYHLGQLMSERLPEYTFIVIDRKRKQIGAYQRYICMILQEFFFVQVVFSGLYDPLADTTHKTIEIYGSKENVAVAEYCYYFLENRVTQLWRVNKAQFGREQRVRKKSFFIGVIQGFYQKLDTQRQVRRNKAEAKENGELVVAEDSRLAAFVALRCPHLRRSSGGSGRVFVDTYQKGMAEGRKISFNRGIPEGETRLLT